MAHHHAGKKAAKKSAKKVAHKKSAGKKAGHDHHHHGERKDLRRAFEHLGRLEALEPHLDEGAAAPVRTLAELARAAMLAEVPGSSAELLRAAEHFAFASLSGGGSEPRVSTALREAIDDEFKHRRHKAAERWEDANEDHPPQLQALYELALQNAEEAFGADRLRPALEYIRAADSLTHVDDLGESQLPEGKGEQGKLKNSKKKLKG